MKNSVLLVVDMQNDFTRQRGKASAYTPEVDEIVPVLNQTIRAWCGREALVLAVTTSWKSPVMRLLSGGAVARGSYGAAWDDRVHTDGAVFIEKGSKTVFSSTAFLRLLEQSNINHLILSGLAAEHCIRITAEDAIKRGMGVSLLTDAIASYRSGRRMRVFRRLQKQGCRLITSSHLFTQQS